MFWAFFNDNIMLSYQFLLILQEGVYNVKGRVKTFNKQKGYGFINAEEVDGDIFFHYSSIVMEGFKTIEVDAEVEFDLEKTDKGQRASNVRLIEKK